MAHDFGFEPSLKDYIFVSYCGRYPETLKRTADICNELNNTNVPLWYDKAIPLGTKYATEIANRIANCNCMLIFISEDLLYNPEGEEDSYVLVEFDIAKRKRKLIIPVFMDKIDGTRIHEDFDEFYSLIKKLQGINIFAGSTLVESAQIIKKTLEKITKLENSTNKEAETRAEKVNNNLEKNKEFIKNIHLLHLDKSITIGNGEFEFSIVHAPGNDSSYTKMQLIRRTHNSETVMFEDSHHISGLFHNAVYYGICFDKGNSHLILEQVYFDEYCKDITFDEYVFVDPFGDGTKYTVPNPEVVVDIFDLDKNTFSFAQYPVRISL